MTSNGRQQISQSVTNRCDGTEASTASSNVWPQNGHCTDSIPTMAESYSLTREESSFWVSQLSNGPAIRKSSGNKARRR
jgi:hypothetical protein